MWFVAVLLATLTGCSGPAAPEVPSERGFTLAFQSRLEGEISPCGCPKRPLGGLPRRNTALQGLIAAGPVLIVDAGESLTPVASTPASQPVEREKADLILGAWAQGGLDATALGATDWSLGADWLQERIAAYKTPVLAANLRCGGQAPYPPAWVGERGGVKVGVIGLALLPDAGVPGCEASDPQVALREARAALAPVDVVVVLYPGDARQLGEVQGVDFVLDARPKGPTDLVPLGETLLLSPGPRGKYLGAVRLDLVEGGVGFLGAIRREKLAEEVVRYGERRSGAKDRLANAATDDQRERLQIQVDRYTELIESSQLKLDAMAGQPASHRVTVATVDLGEEIPDDPATAALLAKTLEKITALAAPAEGTLTTRAAPPSSPYAGSDACAGCHAEISAQWATTDHAGAWKTLQDAHRDGDPECFSCHVTGAGREGGPKVAAEAGGLRDVQCEACHGPARAHLADPKVHPLKPDQATCQGCHDGVRDGGRFDFPTYLPKISHRSPP